MKDASKIYLIADNHFYHKNIIKYCDRPFISVKQMNEMMIDSWNSTVHKGDRVIVAGDFCLSGKDNLIEIGRQLNGRKTLILGNHDSAALSTYYEADFECVSKYPIVLENEFIVSHYPLSIPSDSYFYNIYGHVHNSTIFKDITKNSFCISAERINYKPISLDAIRKQIQTYRDNI